MTSFPHSNIEHLSLSVTHRLYPGRFMATLNTTLNTMVANGFHHKAATMRAWQGTMASWRKHIYHKYMSYIRSGSLPFGSPQRSVVFGSVQLIVCWTRGGSGTAGRLVRVCDWWTTCSVDGEVAQPCPGSTSQCHSGVRIMCPVLGKIPLNPRDKTSSSLSPHS